MKPIFHIVCLILGLLLISINQYTIYVTAQQTGQPSDFANEDLYPNSTSQYIIELENSLNSSELAEFRDLRKIESSETVESVAPGANPTDFRIYAPEGQTNNTTEENMTGESTNPLRGAREQGQTGDFALQLPPEVRDLLQDTEPGSVTTDFGDDETNKFEFNTRKIADELIRLPPVEIRQYSITALSVTDIKEALSFLNSFHLAKVLLNIPAEDLLEVKNRLSPITFNQTINRLPVENRTQIEDRLSSIPTIP